MDPRSTIPEAAHTPPVSEERALAQALERLLEVEPSERSLRRLLGALLDAVAAADSAAVVAAEAERPEILASVGCDESAGVAPGLAAPEAVRFVEWPGAPLPSGTRVACAVPLASGALLVGSRTADSFSESEIFLVRAAADRAALALATSRLARERDEARDEAARAKADLAARRPAVDKILGIVGHDLRNPLGAIQMSAALLQKKGGLTGWQARTVERIRSSTGRMGRIIADLLSYTRTRLGTGIPIARRATSLEEVVRRAVDELAAANPDRAFEVEIRGEARGDWDADRLEQVASNLVSNAVDHGAPGTPVRVTVDGTGDEVSLEVVDRGDPFPPEVLAHLFEPFAQGPDEQSRKGHGLGLGLFIAKEIVRGHGGTIAVRSDGETAIVVRLPRRA